MRSVLPSQAIHLLMQPNKADSLHPTEHEKTAAEECLLRFRAELHKIALELGEECPYSPERIDEITKSEESFEKAAREEAQCVWVGIEDTLVKAGADEEFLNGLRKEAFIRPLVSMLGKGLAKAGPALGKGLEHGMWGSMLGSGVGLPMVGGAIGLAGGTLGYGRAGLLAGAGLAGAGLAGTKAIGGAFGDSGNDITGHAANRNRALPFASNKLTGSLGGALLGGLLANEMGMSGAGAWMMPVLGGLAGYHHLPNLMNKWKDPYGYGANAISDGAARMNRAMPLN